MELSEPFVSHFHETWFNFKSDEISLMPLTHHGTRPDTSKGIENQITG